LAGHTMAWWVEMVAEEMKKQVLAAGCDQVELDLARSNRT
jgi:hypothetical protein